MKEKDIKKVEGKEKEKDDEEGSKDAELPPTPSVGLFELVS